jgi:hypothetical protein
MGEEAGFGNAQSARHFGSLRGQPLRRNGRAAWPITSAALAIAAGVASP